MINVMRKYYDLGVNKLRLIEIDEKEVLKEDFAKHFLVTLTEDIVGSFAVSREENNRLVTNKLQRVDHVEPMKKIEIQTEFTGKLYSGAITGFSCEDRQFNYKLSLSLSPSKSNKMKCKISGDKIGIGTFSECYPLCVEEKTEYVAKFPKIILSEPKDLLPEIEGTLLTKYFASKFNLYIGKAEQSGQPYGKDSKKIEVISLYIIEDIDCTDPDRSKIFFAQTFLEGDFIKYNNNYGWRRIGEATSNLLAQAFSHFTYEYSMGLIMVTDIQGVYKRESGLWLTDPAIHSYVLKGRFGKTNHGRIGMIRFFKTHKCNKYCKALSLMDPKTIDRSKAKEIKEEKKGEKKFGYLFKDFNIDIDEWRKKIRDFKMETSLEPIASEFRASQLIHEECVHIHSH
eukprot:TRINITY_DN1615_c0_g2_i9.p1 TRINITY_DN1615_c0_g2~~TRINITY_DN1615_c0_g2_i9.p1  ORF type:complete len:398 (+),score=108.66 TRINITY_DN1615_c0_g2_i9:134-1327(+)